MCILSPHKARRLVGTDLFYPILASAMIGSCLLVFADIVAKTAISPMMLPVGAVTALLGAPVLIYLLFVRKGWVPA